jgi:hypothetical protein
MTTIILGAQWGDEGKGKLTDILCAQAQICARAAVSWSIQSQCFGLSDKQGDSTQAIPHLSPLFILPVLILLL